MTLKGRLQKVEEALDANKKFLLWLDAKAVGGLVSYWERGFSPGHARVVAKAAEMADFSRAAALTVSGDGRQFKRALQQLCPELALM
jgi:hypothetical protein